MIDTVIPIPVRADLMVRVHIPEQLTIAESEKVRAVIMAYAKSDESANQTQPAKGG